MKHDWEYKKLGEVCTVSAGQGAPQGDQNYCDDGTPFVKAGNLEGLICGMSELDIQKVSDVVAREHKLKLQNKGAVLFAKSGMSCMKGYVHVLTMDCYVVSHLAILTPKSIESNFLKYYLRFAKTYSLVKDEAYPSISLSDISDFRVPVPSLAIQEAIVAELDKLSEIIEKKKQQVKELDALAQAIFYDMFGDILEVSPKTCLKDIADYHIGLTYSPSNVSEKGCIVLRSSNIQNNALDFEDTVRVNMKINENKIVHNGDILMCARNGSARLVGKVARIRYSKEEMSFGAFMTIIRSRYNDFLFYFFLSHFFRNQLTTAKTATINQITTKMLDGIMLNVPTAEKQQTFAAKIEAIEQQKALINQSIQEAQTLFDARMEYWFGE